jgi:Novel STAND NTPase 1
MTPNQPTEDAGAEQVTKEEPWPRLRAYDEAEEHFFHGRRRETNALLQLVARDSLTVFFGISGIGKTSLLRAGLFPCLRREGFFPVRIRLDFAEPEADFAAQVKREFEGEVGRYRLQVALVGGSGGDPETLWQYFHGRRLWRLADMLTPVLVLDQFEEIFTLGAAPSRAAAVSEFVTELADLVENQIPQIVRDRVDRAREPLHFDTERQPLHVVLSLREDYLAYLEGLVPLMPSLNKGNRFRLLPMKGVQALEAVRNPGAHIIDDAEARDLVFRISYVRQSRHGDDRTGTTPDDRVLERREVEPFLLSLVCTELNDQRIEQRRPKITGDLLETAKGGVRAILQRFYEGCFAGLLAGVRVFVEEQLVSPAGYRQPVALDDLRMNPEVAQSLDTLVNRRLIRKEQDPRGVQRVELVHDVLTPIAVESRNRRIVAAAEKRAWERQRARWKKYGAALLFLLAGLIVFLYIDAVRNRRAAEQERDLAEQRLYEAREAAQVSAKSLQQAANSATGARERIELQSRAETELAAANRREVPDSASRAEPRARVYVQVRDQEQADNVRKQFGSLYKQSRFVFPGIEILPQVGPNQTEVRYFRKAERAGAEEIAGLLRQGGIEAQVTYIPGYEASARIRPGHYEIWFARDALR